LKFPVHFGCPDINHNRSRFDPCPPNNPWFPDTSHHHFARANGFPQIFR